MLTIALFWEDGWLDPKVELAMMRQLKGAYKVDRIIATPVLLENRTNVECFKTMDKALATCGDDKRVFLIPPGRNREGIDIEEYEFKKDSVLVFGKAGETLTRFIKPGDDVVSIYTPGNSALFTQSVLGQVLYEYRQQNPIKRG